MRLLSRLVVSSIHILSLAKVIGRQLVFGSIFHGLAGLRLFRAPAWLPNVTHYCTDLIVCHYVLKNSFMAP